MFPSGGRPDNTSVRGRSIRGAHPRRKSHSGAYTVLGVGGPMEAKSGKQKNVTKSSTEAELVALSDHAGRGINLRNFLAGQGYGVVPVIIYQDNLSCMAIMARGGPTSERSRHISIRYFWLCERIKLGEDIIEKLFPRSCVCASK